MKLLNKSIYALSLVGMLGLWSCSSEEGLQGGQTEANGQRVPLTLTVSRGDAQTRTILYENEEAGLDSKWQEGDKVYVYNKNGIQVGELTIESGIGTSVGVFKGEFTGEEGSTDNYAIWYFDASNANVSTYDDGNSRGVQVDLKKQNFASAEELSVMEVLGTTDINDDGGVQIIVRNDGATVAEDITLESKLAMARFSLEGVGLPEGTEGTLNIYNADGWSEKDNFFNTKNVYKAIFSTSDVGQSLSGPDGITVENAVAGKDVFVAFAPGEYRLGFTFTTTEGEEYVFEYTSSTTIQKGKYYNDGVDAEGNVLGAPLSFKHKDGRDDPKRFGIWYFSPVVNSRWNIDTPLWAWDESSIMTADNYDMPVKGYGDMFPNNEVNEGDEVLYEFLFWAPEFCQFMYPYNPPSKEYRAGDKFNFKYNVQQTSKDERGYCVFTYLYAVWNFHYTLEFELEDDVIIEGAETLDYVYESREVNLQLPIIKEGVKVSRPGYTLKAWIGKSHSGDITYYVNNGNEADFSSYIVKRTFVPVWEENPHTVSTSGYEHGVFK